MKILDVLMPNDLCARCDAAEPELNKLFTANLNGNTKPLRLGFCSDSCFNSFVRGIEAAKDLEVL